jgi:hypothetical protein
MTPLTVFAVFVAVWLAAGPTGAVELAGTVAALQGSASAIGPNGLERRLHIGSTILVGDRLSTENDARLRLVLNDGAQISLGEQSSLAIEVFDPGENTAFAILALDQGVLVASAGDIARSGPRRFTIETPLAVLSLQEGEVLADLYPDRLVLTLFSAAAMTATTPQGSVDLTQPGTGVDIAAGEPPGEPTIREVTVLESERQAITF